MAEIDVPHCLYWAKLLKTSAIFSADYENNALLGHNPKAVSYTHLTLPTIYSV